MFALLASSAGLRVTRGHHETRLWERHPAQRSPEVTRGQLATPEKAARRRLPRHSLSTFPRALPLLTVFLAETSGWRRSMCVWRGLAPVVTELVTKCPGSAVCCTSSCRCSFWVELEHQHESSDVSLLEIPSRNRKRSKCYKSWDYRWKWLLVSSYY